MCCRPSLPVRHAVPQRCVGSGWQLAVLPRPVLYDHTLHEVWALPKVSYLALKGRLLAALSVPCWNIMPCRQQQRSDPANSGSPSTAQGEAHSSLRAAESGKSIWRCQHDLLLWVEQPDVPGEAAATWRA